MNSKLKKLLILVIPLFLFTVGIISLVNRPKEMLTVAFVNKTGNLPFSSSIDLNLYAVSTFESETILLYDAYENQQDIIVIDSINYLNHLEHFNDYTVVASKNKVISLLTKPDLNLTGALISGILSIEDESMAEIHMNQVLMNQDTHNVTLNEVITNKQRDSANYLIDNNFNYTFLEEPYLSYALKQGAHLFESFDINQGACDFIIVKNELYLNDEALIMDLLTSYNQGVARLNKSPIEHINQLLSDSGFTSIYYFDKPPQFYFFTDVPYDAYDIVITWLYNTKMVKDKYPYDDLITNILRN